MKKAIKYSAVISFVFLVLFVNLFFLMRVSLLDWQSRKLEAATTEIFEQIKDSDFSSVELSEKDIDFVVYGLKSKRVLSTSNAEILPLPNVQGIQRHFLKNHGGTQNRTEILYLCRTYDFLDGKKICVQVSVPAEKKNFQKLLQLFPRSILKILIPLILILFFTISFYFVRLKKIRQPKRVHRECESRTEKADCRDFRSRRFAPSARKEAA